MPEIDLQPDEYRIGHDAKGTTPSEPVKLDRWTPGVPLVGSIVLLALMGWAVVAQSGERTASMMIFGGVLFGLPLLGIGFFGRWLLNPKPQKPPKPGDTWEHLIYQLVTGTLLGLALIWARSRY